MVALLLGRSHVVIEDFGGLESTGGQKAVGEEKGLSVAVFDEDTVIGEVAIDYPEVRHAPDHTVFQAKLLAATQHRLRFDQDRIGRGLKCGGFVA